VAGRPEVYRSQSLTPFPVSVKGVVFIRGRAVLLRNERDEWELPGGKLEPGEAPEACVAREIEEELGIRVTPGPLLDAWVYRIADGVEVLILTFGCHGGGRASVIHGPEHRAVGRFAVGDLEALEMPDGYRRSIRAWQARRAARPPAPRRPGSRRARARRGSTG
jgi:8-oxo-dGTP pyrophosphatase MutT (NUDIX family)